jgi:predicted TPR repeat methyltransferase
LSFIITATQLVMGNMRDNRVVARQVFDSANVLYRNGQLIEAVSKYKEAINLEPEAGMYTNLGSALLDLNRKSEAVEMYNTALQLDNESADAAFNLAMVHHDEGEERRAIELYKLCLRSAPDRSDAWMNLASCLHAVGDMDKSIFAYTQALAYEKALERKGSTTGAPSGSEGGGSRIISIRGKVHEYLGRAILRKRDNEKAATSGRVLEGREAALQAMTDEALGHLEEAVRLDPDNADVAKHMIASNSNSKSPKLQIDSVASTEYVRKLFDDYSSDFESSLAGLDYKVPALMVQELLTQGQSGNGKWRMVVDLGCGTGLLGPLLRDAFLAHPPSTSMDGDDDDAVTVVAGVDLSLKMLEVAAKKGTYDYLTEGDVVEFVQALTAGRDSNDNDRNRLRLVFPAAGSGSGSGSGSGTDTKAAMAETMSILHSLQDSRVLYAAADVLVYIGDLTALFAALGEAMRQGDTFIFTVENADVNPQRSQASEESGWILQMSGRYAHHVQFIQRLAQKNGMELVQAKRIVPRKELNEDIQGYMCILQAASE